MSATSRASHGAAAARLAEILRRCSGLMRALRAARKVGASDWLIAAGAIRDVVWDDLHGFDLTATPRDADLAFFDPSDLSEARERVIESQLRSQAPDLPWDVKNQAAVHLWYPKVFGIEVSPFASSAQAIATLPEVATCVGVRLLGDDDMLVIAPHGLDDLLNGVCRHNPTRVSGAFYRHRLSEKAWPDRWPRVQYVPVHEA
jgi:hypothetical protein